LSFIPKRMGKENTAIKIWARFYVKEGRSLTMITSRGAISAKNTLDEKKKKRKNIIGNS